MNFHELALARQSCRKYNSSKIIDDETIRQILEIARLAPSACNSQAYNITVCKNNTAKLVAKETQAMGMNKFTDDAPIMLVISESNYTLSAKFGSIVKKNDYRSIDIGILAAYITAAATEMGIGSCILGWFNDSAIRKICDIKSPVKLVIALGYPANEAKEIRTKKRKELSEFVNMLD